MKRLELLKQSAPGLLSVGIETLDDLEPSLERAVAAGAGAVIVPGTGTIPQAEVNARIVQLARRWRLLSLGFGKPFAEGGGLIGFGPSPQAPYRRAAAELQATEVVE